LHPLTFHVAAPNNGVAPRVLLSGAVTTDMHGWGPVKTRAAAPSPPR
jgi:hypothetical protein